MAPTEIGVFPGFITPARCRSLARAVRLVFFASCASCSRTGPSIGDPANAVSSSPAPPLRAAAPPIAEVQAAPRPEGGLPGTGEATRTTPARLEQDPALLPFLAPLRAHFGPGAGTFAVQSVDLAGGRTGYLVERSDGADPIVLSTDRDQLVWSKPHPVAGITPPVVHLAIAPRPDGGVALFGYVATLRLVAARMWADDGNAYAEIELGSFDGCDNLSAGYAPGVGWVVACASHDGARAQRLREDGTNAWGRAGVSVGAASAVGPATVVFDSTSTWTLLERATGVGADHLLAWRYDADARPVWPAPIDVGALPPSRVALASDRFDAHPVAQGGVRVELWRGLAGRRVKAAEIGSDASVRFIGRDGSPAGLP
jgi:hypothetical protein